MKKPDTVKNILKLTLAIIIAILTILGGLFVFDDFLNTRIDNRINDADYISRLSKSLRPYLIFNQNGSIVYDHGAEILLDSISVDMKLSFDFDKPITITIHPKKFLKIKPLLECLTDISYQEKASRYGFKSWKYILTVNGYSEIQDNLFKIEILD